MSAHDIEPTARERMQAIIDSLGLSVKAEFVPFSQSRNKGEKQPSLNWRVKLMHKRPNFDAPVLVLTTDYMAGSGHCPAYKEIKARTPTHWDNIKRNTAIREECESGKHHLTRKPILPDAIDVIWSLVQDADVLNYSGFDDWADCFGYDKDSRKAEAIYRQCLDLALKLRNAIGDVALADLIEAGRDY